MDYQEVEILLVEDNDEDAGLTIRALKKMNLANRLVRVEDGEEALAFLYSTGKFSDRNIQNLPKLILLDLKMPKINGIEVLEKIKSDERTKHIPVVILTSSHEDPDIKKCYKLGTNSYIVKPVDYNDFFKSVTDIGVYWMMLNKV